MTGTTVQDLPVMEVMECRWSGPRFEQFLMILAFYKIMRNFCVGRAQLTWKAALLVTAETADPAYFREIKQYLPWHFHLYRIVIFY